MASYSNWSGLIAAVQEKCGEILDEFVRPVAEDILHEHIRDDIYASYSPVGRDAGGYDRRDALGGRGNTVGEVQDNNLLVVTNIAPPSPSVFGSARAGAGEDELLYWIENGLVPNYFNEHDYVWMHPRPAVENAQDEINISSDIRAAIKNGISQKIG